MKLSIIIPTLGRRAEVEKLLQSIADANIACAFEIIIVDQNTEALIDDIVAMAMSWLPIRHYKVGFKGLSKAKNFGFRKAAGVYISFPDDDCLIYKNTYAKAIELIRAQDLDIIFGKCLDEKGNDSVLQFKKKAYYLNKNNMAGGFVEATTICKADILRTYEFDENMGVGTFFGAEEGFDWLYRILSDKKAPKKVLFSPDVEFYHPQVILSKGDLASLNRVFKYRCGTAYLCVKHHLHMKYYKRILISIFGYILYKLVDKKSSDFYAVEFSALLMGKRFAKKELK
ncbi:hypothetical protein IQ37_06200 [Chryseobacterium piperi]|uniref:Glycosyltransferase 2-like domain-containing protein n=1 Tax=Chryseobacterium piperi TaxID=558152 RepID=A0A086BKC3_9FLAO|nr:hypothetical protein IQ37_06200 [Chryseobacterium piperi]